MKAAAVTRVQMYVAIAIPTFAFVMGLTMNIIVLMWQARGIEKLMDGLEKRIDRVDLRLDKIERSLEVIQADLKQFYADIARFNERGGW